MGLDITSYSNLKYVGHHDVPEDHPWEDDADPADPMHIETVSHKLFAPHALFGVANIGPARGYPSEFVSGGCFEVTDKTESDGFRAGSYGGYSAWRNDLAAAYNPYREGDGSPNPEGPFYELLWFADNEGTICAAAARNLLEDFRNYENDYRVRQLGTESGDWFTSKYRDWMRACELASQDGLIEFH